MLTTDAYRMFVEGTALREEIPSLLSGVDPARPETTEAASRSIREAFDRAPFPPALRAELTTAYEQFVTRHRVGFSAVRSSSTAEDLEGASFAGLQETYLNVTGIEAILEAVKR
ncbi:Pyruvate phosphate dikinase, PEP/pyruvate-binding domain protein, partial [mine drainage metagenome]